MLRAIAGISPIRINETGSDTDYSKKVVQIKTNGMIFMKTTRIIFRCALLSIILVMTGCASVTHDSKNQLMKLRAQSNFQGAAQLFLTKDQKPKYDTNNLQQTLEAAKAFHDAGRWKDSNDAFAHAHNLMPWKEDTVDTPKEVADLVATTITSSSFGPYQGKIYEGGMIDFYRALNHLMLKDENARVSFNRLQERQKNSVVQLGAFTRASATGATTSAQQAQKTGAGVDMEKIQGDLGRGTSKVRQGVMLSEIRNAAGDTMSALFRSTSADPQDRDESRIQPMLAAAGESAASPEGKNLITQLKQYLATNNSSLNNAVIVLYEDGNGPGFGEFRLDLPMYLVSDKVLYSGIALPEFREGQSAGGRILVGDEAAATVLLTDMNRIAGLEFEKSYDGVVTKAIVSTVIKTVAQYAANEAIDRQVEKNKMDPLAGALLQIGTAVTQAATTRADTRVWRNLPNTIQIAIVDRPASGSLPLFTAAREPVGNALVAEEGNYLVLVKAASPQATPIFYVAKL